MTTYDEAWVAAEEAKRAYVAEHGLYREEDEHSSCGVGLVVAIDGKAQRKVVENGINALKAIWHRGAVDADGMTGDGAGIHVQIPAPFFYDQIRRTGHEPDTQKLIAVGQIFLPRTDFRAQETCRTIVEAEVLRMGYYIYGWRHVPVDISCLGEKANATRPEIEQIIISNNKGVDDETFERELYVVRRRIEKAVSAAQIAGFYICSLSCRSMIYKGMMLAEQVAEFYPDLQDERFGRSRPISERTGRTWTGSTQWVTSYVVRAWWSGRSATGARQRMRCWRNSPAVPRPWLPNRGGREHECGTLPLWRRHLSAGTTRADGIGLPLRHVPPPCRKPGNGSA